MSQSRKHSLMEITLSTSVGFGAAMVANAYLFPLFFNVHVNNTENFLITCCYTVISIVRGYIMRRVFNFLHTRGIL